MDYPADLPAAAKDLSSRAQIGFGYVEPDGDDWTGGGTLHVESLADDGTFIGSFDAIRMSGANNSQMTLTNGRVRARLRKR